MSSNAAAGLFSLSKLVFLGQAYFWRRLTNERGRDKRAMHRRAKSTAEDSRAPCNLEEVPIDVVLCLEDELAMEGSAKAQR